MESNETGIGKKAEKKREREEEKRKRSNRNPLRKERLEECKWKHRS